MTLCAESSMAAKACQHSALILALTLLASCAGNKVKEGPAPPPVLPEVEEPTEAEEQPPAEKTDPEGRFQEALTLMKQRKTEEAIRAFLALSQDFPEYSGPHANIGIMLAEQDKLDSAIAALTRAAKKNPQNAVAFNWLGILTRKSGDFERARLAYAKAIEIKPDYAAAHLNLGILLDDSLNDGVGAIAAYRQYMELTGGNDLRALPWIAEIREQQAIDEKAAATEQRGQESTDAQARAQEEDVK